MKCKLQQMAMSGANMQKWKGSLPKKSMLEHPLVNDGMVTALFAFPPLSNLSGCRPAGARIGANRTQSMS